MLYNMIVVRTAFFYDKFIPESNGADGKSLLTVMVVERFGQGVGN
jgi:hypothetical protein